MVNNSRQYQQSEQPSLNSDGHQFHKYQEYEQSPLNSDGHQFHQYQQNEQSPLIVSKLSVQQNHMV